MWAISDIKKKYMGNRNLVDNVLGSFAVRGLGFLVSFVLFPLYLRYFDDNAILGCWFTMCSVLSWIQVFDLGIGNGLRNHLTTELSLKNYVSAREYISSSYILMGGVTLLVAIVTFIVSRYISWNTVFNISEQSLSPACLRDGVVISLCGVLGFFFLKLILSILYALQQSALPNLLNLISTILLMLFLWLYQPTGNAERDFITIAWVQAITMCVPLIVATVSVFARALSNCKPSVHFFRWNKATAVLSLGLLFLLLQLLYMAITVTNEFFISYFFDPSFVVEYQIYFKLFSIVSSLIMLALIPVWSAVTKAFVEKRYGWILKLIRFLYGMAGVAVLLQLAIIPFLDFILRIWLGEKAIEIDLPVALLFALMSCEMIWVSVLTSIVNGLGKLKCQLYGFLFATLFKVVAIVLLASQASWTLVVIATIIGLLPYCIVQPVLMHRQLQALNKKEEVQHG